MKPDEFKCRVSAVIEGIQEGFRNFDVALREERRKYWLLFLDAFEKEVEVAEDKHRREELNPYRAGISFGITALGEIVKLVAKDTRAGQPLTRLGDNISKGKDLVIAVSPEEGIPTLRDFEMLELPRGECGKRDEKGRLLLNPSEFKRRIQELRSCILGMEEPFPLPIEVKQAATALWSHHRRQI